MRITLILTGAILLIGAICFGADDEKFVPKCTKEANFQPAAKAGTEATESPSAKPIAEAGAKTSNEPTEMTPVRHPVTEERSADEAAIRQTDASFALAYQQGNAQSVAAHFAPDAEYVDEFGNVVQGREAIEQSLTEFFDEHRGCKLEMNIETIRFLSSEIAVEDGGTTTTHAESPTPVESRYTTVHVKTNGKWLVASVRDHAPKHRREYRIQLKQLEWLVGDWVDEGDDLIANFSCQSIDNGNFLLRTFTIHIAGQEAMSGTQRIGWDPLTGKFRAWIFDSEGGYAEGFWYRAGKNWVLKCSGVTADGQTASYKSIYTLVNDHTMTWQSVDYEIAGVQQADSEVVTIVRQAPVPKEEIAVKHE